MSNSDERKESPPPEKKHSKLRALLIALSCALLFFVLTPSNQAPASLVGLFHGEEVTTTKMLGGTEIELSVEGDSAAIAKVRSVLESRGVTVVHARAGELRLELPEFEIQAATVWARRMATEGAFSLNRVIEGSEEMKQVYGLMRGADPEQGVSGDIDQWVHDETGKTYVDYYLKSFTREDVEESFEQLIARGDLILPPGTEIAYEEVYSHSRENYWRSYLIDSRKELQQSDIDNSYVYWNPTTNKPEVLIEFSEEGGKRFAELTAAIVGKKVAIVMDSEVTSAPSVQAEITGGSTSISMGGHDPELMNAEAQALTAVLRAPPLPAPVTVGKVTPVAASVSSGSILLVRITMAMILIGLVIFIVAWRVERRTHARPIFNEKGEAQSVRSKALYPLFLTLGAAAGAFALSWVWLPGCEEIFGDTGFYEPGVLYSIVAIGVTPFLFGSVMVDGIAWLVPAWRAHRGADAKHRPSLDQAAMIAGMALLLAQAYFLAAFLDGVGGGAMYSTFASLDTEAIELRYVLGSLILGSSVLYGLAKAIDRWGLGNGFAMILVAAVLPQVPQIFLQAQQLGEITQWGLAEFILLLAGTGMATGYLVRNSARLGDGTLISQPAAGLVPIVLGPMVFVLMGSAHPAVYDALSRWLDPSAPAFDLSRIVTVVVLSLALSAFAFFGPVGKETRVVSGVDRSRLSKESLLALLISVAFPVSLFFVMRRVDHHHMDYMTVMYSAFGTAIMMDLVGGFRARWRNSQLVAVWSLRRPRYLQPLLEALGHANIEVFVRGRHFRLLLGILGAFAPMIIMVPEERASDAREIIKGQL